MQFLTNLRRFIMDESGVISVEYAIVQVSSAAVVVGMLSYISHAKYDLGDVMSEVHEQNIASFTTPLPGQSNLYRSFYPQAELPQKTPFNRFDIIANRAVRDTLRTQKPLTAESFFRLPGTQTILQPAPGVQVVVANNGQIRLEKAVGDVAAVFDPSRNAWYLANADSLIPMNLSTARQLGFVAESQRSFVQLARIALGLPVESATIVPADLGANIATGIGALLGALMGGAVWKRTVRRVKIRTR
jgi:Flp pilus assembly pilin Flp